MRRLKAHDFMQLDLMSLWPLPDERFILEFDDGELETTTRRTAVSWFCWQLVREYPLTKLSIRHHIGNGFLTTGTTLDVLSHIVYDIHHAYYPDPGYDREAVWKRCYEITNHIYNELILKLAPYQTSANVLDLLELYDHPEIAAARGDLRPNQLSINRAYARTKDVLLKSKDLIKNPIVQAIRGGMVKMNQALQILVARGYLTDVDSNIFRKPITVGFFEGLVDLHDSMIESCSAVKALSFTKKPLREVEYFNRKMQLSAVVVRDLIYDDCGSTQYKQLHVDSDMFKGLEGTYYVAEGGTLKPVTKHDRHLIGKDVLFRSAMFCRHRGDGGVCRVCFGDLAWSVPEGTNLGHVSSTEMCHEASQLVLSVKHYDGSSEVDPIDISEHDQDYIQKCEEQTDPNVVTITNRSVLKFNPRIAKMNPYLIMGSQPDAPIENGAGLTGITDHTDINTLSIHRVTSFREIQLGVTNLRGEHRDVYVSVSQGARYGSLSRDMLQYIQDYGYTVTEDGDYRVDLSHWDFDKVAIELPMRHTNMLDYMKEIEVFLRSTAKSKKVGKREAPVKRLTDYTDPVTALVDLYAMVSTRLRVNMSHLEIILLSMMVPADDPDNYNLPAFGKDVRFEEHNKLMAMRSAGGWMAYERQPSIIDDEDSYLIRDREPHVLDPCLHPW